LSMYPRRILANDALWPCKVGQPDSGGWWELNSSDSLVAPIRPVSGGLDE
jgi:hypothetical protein